MATFSAKVTLYDDEDRVIVTDHAYGNTEADVSAAAGALRRRLEQEHPGGNGIISKTKREHPRR